MATKPNKPQITTDLFRALDAASREAADIDAAEKRLEARKDENRARFLELLDALKDAGVSPDDLNKVVPGVVLQTKIKPHLDLDAVLAWALQDDNLMTATPVLTVDKRHVGVVIAAALIDPKFRGVLTVDKTGAEAVAREGKLLDMPVKGLETQRVIAVTPKNLKSGDALAALFEVVDSPLMLAARAGAEHHPTGWYAVIAAPEPTFIPADTEEDAVQIVKSNVVITGRALPFVLVHDGRIIVDGIMPLTQDLPF